jgi:thiol-disulfide isomerase/thioredoxin
MALLSPTDQEKVRESLADMTTPVRLLFFTQTFGCESCAQTRQILDELPPLSDKISIEEVNLVLDQDKAKEYGVDRAPTIAVVAGEPGPPGDAGGPGPPGLSNIRFLGAPSGYEFISLVHAVMLVGGHPSALSEENRRRVAAVGAPLSMQVFTTPT